jgi:hypothetical protein
MAQRASSAPRAAPDLTRTARRCIHPPLHRAPSLTSSAPRATASGFPRTARRRPRPSLLLPPPQASPTLRAGHRGPTAALERDVGREVGAWRKSSATGRLACSACAGHWRKSPDRLPLRATGAATAMVGERGEVYGRSDAMDVGFGNSKQK